MKPNGQQAASKMDHLQQTTHVYVIACAGAVFDLISGTKGDCNQHLVRYATGWVAKSIADATHQELLDLYDTGKRPSFDALAQHVELIAHA